MSRNGSKKKSQPKKPKMSHSGVRPVLFGRRKLFPLADGTTGYSMAQGGTDDCFRAAIATLLQVPAKDVPDPRIDQRVAAGDDIDVINSESWLAFEEWLAGRGQKMTFHENPPPVDRARWIAVASGALDVAGTVEEVEAGLGLGRELKRAKKRAGINVEAAYYFSGHCLVMNYGDLLFDPASGLEAPARMRVMRTLPFDLEYGITIDPKEM